MNSKQLNFDSLVVAIENTHDAFVTQAFKTVNICLTIKKEFNRVSIYLKETL